MVLPTYALKKVISEKEHVSRPSKCFPVVQDNVHLNLKTEDRKSNNYGFAKMAIWLCEDI